MSTRQEQVQRLQVWQSSLFLLFCFWRGKSEVWHHFSFCWEKAFSNLKNKKKDGKNQRKNKYYSRFWIHKSNEVASYFWPFALAVNRLSSLKKVSLTMETNGDMFFKIKSFLANQISQQSKMMKTKNWMLICNRIWSRTSGNTVLPPITILNKSQQACAKGHSRKLSSQIAANTCSFVPFNCIIRCMHSLLSSL